MPTSPPARTIIVGDIHGCIDELRDLLSAVALRPEDHLVTLGDTISKGPDSRGVLEFLLTRPRTTCLLGNMEWRLLQADREDCLHTLPEALRETLESFGREWPRLREAMRRWPLWHSEVEHLCVHAGLRPGRRLEDQTAHDLLHIRRVKGRQGSCPVTLSKPWWELHTGPPVVVFGHTPMPSPLVSRWALGLDTGCVTGGHLTALVLPERRLIQVPARRAYAGPA